MSAPANPKRSRKVEKVSEMQKGVETGQSGAHIKQVSSSSSFKMGNSVHSGRQYVRKSLKTRAKGASFYQLIFGMKIQLFNFSNLTDLNFCTQIKGYPLTWRLVYRVGYLLRLSTTVLNLKLTHYNFNFPKEII